MMNTTNVPFLRPAFAPAQGQPPLVARQPLGAGASPYAQGLADALEQLQRGQVHSAPELGENLMAQALLQYAQRNSRGGQADPAGWRGDGGGGYGPAPDYSLASTDAGAVQQPMPGAPIAPPFAQGDPGLAAPPPATLALPPNFALPVVTKPGAGSGVAY